MKGLWLLLCSKTILFLIIDNGGAGDARPPIVYMAILDEIHLIGYFSIPYSSILR